MIICVDCPAGEKDLLPEDTLDERINVFFKQLERRAKPSLMICF